MYGEATRRPAAKVVVHELTSGIDLLEADLEVSDRTLIGWEFTLPYKGCSLLWYEWPAEIEKPVFDPKIGYHSIIVRGQDVIEPHRTTSYGAGYKFSGTEHKVEAVTPPAIQALMDFTSDMYPTSHKYKVMCLANDYNTGYQKVGMHADDMRQWGEIKDVVCWVTGATRRLILRHKAGEHKHEIILSVSIPEGIYIMKGNDFQVKMKHEIPREKEALFNKLIKLVPNGIMLPHPEYPERLVVQAPTKLQQADWLAAHPEVVKKNMPDKYKEYKMWATSRQSYTIRFFKK